MYAQRLGERADVAVDVILDCVGDIVDPACDDVAAGAGLVEDVLTDARRVELYQGQSGKLMPRLKDLQ